MIFTLIKADFELYDNKDVLRETAWQCRKL